ncbi:MAG: TlyA family rRNA (cytidine-2'-O)-methyltransferase, partial [Peptococcaceae bacterium]|nr:TlyA family rRNA (cytidine-2'-O)-methyltransferase [Peptococcaceae bacterium]
KDGGHVLALIKPQFEAGKEKVGKKGVVRDPAVHQEVVEKILALCKEINLTVWGLDFSPVKGPEGNIEYLLWGCKNPDTDFVPDAVAVVAAAHDRLD